jgi:hypothetical protein
MFFARFTQAGLQVDKSRADNLAGGVNDLILAEAFRRLADGGNTAIFDVEVGNLIQLVGRVD